MEEQVWPFGSARGGGDPGPKQIRILQKHAIYAGMVKPTDRSVGLVLDRVKSLGMHEHLHAWYREVDAKFLQSKDPWRHKR